MAAARKKAAAEAAITKPDLLEFFCSRYPDGREGMAREHAQIESVREENIARYVELKRKGLEPHQIAEVVGQPMDGPPPMTFEGASAALLRMSYIGDMSVEAGDAASALLVIPPAYTLST